MVKELDKGRLYLICPDHDVHRETDNLRMAWAMQDIPLDLPPSESMARQLPKKIAECVEENRNK